MEAQTMLTFEEFSEILGRAHKWRDERGLDPLAGRSNLSLTIMEELLEFERSNTETDKVDALCDIFIYTINSAPSDVDYSSFWGYLAHSAEYYHRHYQSLSPMESQLAVFTLLGEFAFDFAKVVEYSLPNHFFALGRVLGYLDGMLEVSGYDSAECLRETLKEIESRTGAYDPIQRKWVKDTSDEAKAKWYKANYTKKAQ